MGEKSAKDEEFEEVEDERDPNVDMLYYMGNVKMQKRDLDLNIDRDQGAIAYLFEDEGMDGSFRIPIDFQDELAKSKFSNRLSSRWGEEETQLRTAVYVSFMREE